jgi:hypothetical protein
VERVIGLNTGAILTRGEAWLLAAAATVVMVSLTAIAATSEKARSSRSVAGFLLPHCLIAAAVLLLPVVVLPLVPHIFVIVLALLAVLQVVLSRTERKIGLSGVLQAGD